MNYKYIVGVVCVTAMLSTAAFSRTSAPVLQFPENAAAETILNKILKERFLSNPRLPFVQSLSEESGFIIPDPLIYTYVTNDKKPHFEFPISHKVGTFSVMGRVNNIFKKARHKTLRINDESYTVAILNQVYTIDNNKKLKPSSFYNVKKQSWVLLGFNQKTMQVERIVLLDNSDLMLAIEIELEKSNLNN